MSVKIGHASIDENGKIRGGASGDQTGKEVCIRDYYAKGWNVVLRPKKSSIAEKSAAACEAGCHNPAVGYDQNQRNSFYNEAKKKNFDLSKVKTKCETDCSAFMTLCAVAGGVKKLQYTGNAPATSTMRKVFLDSGEYIALTDKKYLNSDEYLKRGDILLKEGHHTAMVLSNGSKAGVVTKVKEVATDVKENISKALNTDASTRYYGICSKSIKSLVDGLKAVGERDVSLAHRTRIAKANGISKYTGTVTQNTKLLNYLKKGQLIRVS